MPRRKDFPRKTEISPETQRLLFVLKNSMKQLGFTNRAVQDQLGWSGSYLSRLFSGLIELRVEHVIDIAHVIGVQPEELFQISFPRKSQPSSMAAAHLWESLVDKESGAPEAPPEATDAASDLEQALEKMMARALQKLLGRMS
jgi:transcriptional regulator with XRE-family HTH domain